MKEQLEEIPANQNYYWYNNQNLLSNISISSNSSANDKENVATIKFRYEVKAKFEIQ